MTTAGGILGDAFRLLRLLSRRFEPCRLIVSFVFGRLGITFEVRKNKGGSKGLLFATIQSFTVISTVFRVLIPVFSVLIPVAKKCFAGSKKPLSRRFFPSDELSQKFFGKMKVIVSHKTLVFVDFKSGVPVGGLLGLRVAQLPQNIE